ncbi:hypothetical protein ACSNOK_07360 [Streptomyces sp. URMC 126]
MLFALLAAARRRPVTRIGTAVLVHDADAYRQALTSVPLDRTAAGTAGGAALELSGGGALFDQEGGGHRDGRRAVARVLGSPGCAGCGRCDRTSSTAVSRRCRRPVRRFGGLGPRTRRCYRLRLGRHRRRPGERGGGGRARWPPPPYGTICPGSPRPGGREAAT